MQLNRIQADLDPALLDGSASHKSLKRLLTDTVMSLKVARLALPKHLQWSCWSTMSETPASQGGEHGLRQQKSVVDLDMAQQKESEESPN